MSLTPHPKGFEVLVQSLRLPSGMFTPATHFYLASLFQIVKIISSLPLNVFLIQLSFMSVAYTSTYPLHVIWLLINSITYDGIRI